MQQNSIEAIGIALALGVALALLTGSAVGGLGSGLVLAWAFSPVRPGGSGRRATGRGDGVLHGGQHARR
jgi:hypothetical protein